MKPLTQNELHQVSGGVELATIAAGVVGAGGGKKTKGGRLNF